MSELTEKSRFLGRPVQLFVFERQDTTLRIAAGEDDIEIGANTYVAGGQIEHSEIKSTVERAKDKINIKFPYLRDPAALEFPPLQGLGDWWFPWPPGDPVRVTCLLHHRGDTDPPAFEWSGVVVQPEFTDVELSLKCELTNGFARARGQGPRFQRSCWKLPYSTGIRGCNMVRADFELPGTLTSFSGTTLQAAEFAASPFNLGGGKVTWVNPATGFIEQRSITAHAGDTVTINYPGGGLASALAVVALPTCPRTWDACALRHERPELHYGGAFYKPVEDPKGESASWA